MECVTGKMKLLWMLERGVWHLDGGIGQGMRIEHSIHVCYNSCTVCFIALEVTREQW